MRFRKGRLFMNVSISKKAELFYKALEDIWSAEQLWRGCPNNAVWHCTQAAEKIMKGFLKCFNRDFDFSHELKELLDAVFDVASVTPDTTEYINYLSRFKSGLRYKNMSTDPTIDDARVAISRTKYIMQEFRHNPVVTELVKEAEEVHIKILSVSMQETPDSSAG